MTICVVKNGKVWMKTIAFVSLTFLLISIAASRGNSHQNAIEDTDILVYSVFNYDNGTTLYLYDISSDEHTLLYQDDGRLSFNFSSNGLLALRTWGNNGELFILDTRDPDQSFINISQEAGIDGFPLGWSDDGRYIAFSFEVEEDQRRAIYVWDGNAAIDITPQNTLGSPQSYDVAWGPDGRLAFTVGFGSSNRNPRSEIYIWDGEATVNFSQNADEDDSAPIWNTKGELAFRSYRNDETMLFLWDGKSFVDGLPDTRSFTRIAPELNLNWPYPTWVNDDMLAFEAIGSQDEYQQIYTWDGQNLTNISQNPNAHSGGSQWSQDGFWAFITFVSNPREQSLHVRDMNNNTVFETRGQYSPAWSSGGSLIFCNRKGRGAWKLSRWDRASVTTLVQGDIIQAQWRSGQSIVCSDG